MSAHACSEEQFGEQPAVGLFATFGLAALAMSWVVAVLYQRDSRSATPATMAGTVTEKELP